MKFRNPETGEVFDSLREASDKFCSDHDCFWSKCPLYKANESRACWDWIQEYPIEAAHLMGYEVVEDEPASDCNGLNEGTNCTLVKEEANMDKPRIARVLGVEVDEVWHVTGNDNAIYRISGGVSLEYAIPKCYEDGYGEWRQSDTVHLIDIINHPDRIIRKPRWTEQEVEDAKAVRRVFGRDGVIERYDKAMVEPYSNLVFDHLYINEDLFPSLRPGESVKLEEIIGGAE